MKLCVLFLGCALLAAALHEAPSEPPGYFMCGPCPDGE